MSKIFVVLGLATLGLMMISADASAYSCKSDYYRGWGVAKLWKQGRANAREDWSNRVDERLGWPWAVWSKAKVKDESCTWNGRRNNCVTKAYPCK